MKYRLVQTCEGVMIKTECENLENFLINLNVRQFTVQGYNNNPRQRAELQGAPIVSQLCGPMWDGDAIRYEDEKTNDVLSR